MNAFQALRILNVNSSSSQTEIKSAYRKMALELHPDKNNGKSEGDEFKKITEAYNRLKKITIKELIPFIKKQLRINQETISKESPNGEHPMTEAYQSKIGANILVNLKRGILIFGKSMNGNSGKITMLEYEQMEKMESLKNHKNQKNNQIFL